MLTDLQTKFKQAPMSPDSPVPLLQPPTRSLGKALRYPKIVLSPNAYPVPMIKEGIKVRQNPSV